MSILDHGLFAGRLNGGSKGSQAFHYPLALAGVFVAYMLAAQIGLSIPFPPGNAAPLWPAAAVSLAAILLFSRGMWLAIFAADLVVGLTHRYATLPSLG